MKAGGYGPTPVTVTLEAADAARLFAHLAERPYTEGWSDRAWVALADALGRPVSRVLRDRIRVGGNRQW